MDKFVVLFCICASAACKTAPPVEEDTSDGGDDHAVHVEPEQATAWGITTGIVSTSDISSRIIVPGVLGLNENRTAHISSYVTGKVTDLSVDLGDVVRQGNALVTISSPEFASAQADYLDANTRCKLASRDFERAQELLSTGSIEEREYLRHEAELEQCYADLAAAESSLHAYGVDHGWMDELKARRDSVSQIDGDPDLIANANLPISSPINGKVIFRDVVVGEHVDPTRTLFTVSSLSTLWAHLDIYENDLQNVSLNSEVIIRSQLFPAVDFPGRIEYVSDVLDEMLRTVKARVEVSNVDGLLKPNMYIQGVIFNRDPSVSIIAIPDEAIVMYHGEPTVFVLGPAEDGEDHLVFNVQHVDTGAMVGDQRIITYGLQAGETIVLRGAFTLKAELDKGAGGGHEGHVH